MLGRARTSLHVHTRGLAPAHCPRAFAPLSYVRRVCASCARRVCVVCASCARRVCVVCAAQFHLKGVRAPGEWEAPNGVYPKQRLLVVTATYQDPEADPSGNLAQQRAYFAPRLCCGSASMAFGRREWFVAGLGALTVRPVITMEQEFARDIRWTDGHGTRHRLMDQWAYVSGAAVTGAIYPGGPVRDADNGGKQPDAFLREVNVFIAKRRTAGHGVLPERFAMLSMEEVLAVRLWTGPAHQPIAAFIRHAVAAVGEQRTLMAHHAGRTFAATVSHLCAAIRKLADVTTQQEAQSPLWLGMRGDLPRSFWVPPEGQRSLCAVSSSYLSSSRSRAVPIAHMQSTGTNVLWQLQTEAHHSDAGLHRGASIAMLSQFAAEEEVRAHWRGGRIGGGRALEGGAHRGEGHPRVYLNRAHTHAARTDAL